MRRHLPIQIGDKGAFSHIIQIIFQSGLLIESNINELVLTMLRIHCVSKLVHLGWHWLVELLPQARLPVSWQGRRDQFVDDSAEEPFVLVIALSPFKY